MLTEGDPSLDFFVQHNVPILIKHSRTVRMDDATVRRDTSMIVPWDSPYHEEFPGCRSGFRLETSVVEGQPFLEP